MAARLKSLAIGLTLMLSAASPVSALDSCSCRNLESLQQELENAVYETGFFQSPAHAHVAHQALGKVGNVVERGYRDHLQAPSRLIVRESQERIPRAESDIRDAICADAGAAMARTAPSITINRSLFLIAFIPVSRQPTGN